MNSRIVIQLDKPKLRHKKYQFIWLFSSEAGCFDSQHFDSQHLDSCNNAIARLIEKAIFCDFGILNKQFWHELWLLFSVAVHKDNTVYAVQVRFMYKALLRKEGL